MQLKIDTKRLKENYIVFLLYLNTPLILLRVMELNILPGRADYVYIIAVVLNGMLWVPFFFRSRINGIFFSALVAIAVITGSLFDFILDFKLYFILIGFLRVMESKDLNLKRLKFHANVVLNIAIMYFAIEVVGLRILNTDLYLALKQKYLFNYYLKDTSIEAAKVLAGWWQPQGINLDGHSSGLMVVLFYMQNKNFMLKAVAVFLLYLSNVKTWFIGWTVINAFNLAEYVRSLRNTFFCIPFKAFTFLSILAMAIFILSWIWHIKQNAIDTEILSWSIHGPEMIISAMLPHGFDRIWFDLYSPNNHFSEFMLSELADKISWFGLIIYIAVTVRHVRGIYLLVLFFGFLHTMHLLWPNTALIFAVLNRAYRAELEEKRNNMYGLVLRKPDSKAVIATSV